MNTRTAFDKLPEISKKTILHFRESYQNGTDDNDPRYWIPKKSTVRGLANMYLIGLRDAGAITDRERQMLYIYVTL